MTYNQLIISFISVVALFLPQQKPNEIPQYDHVIIVVEENHAYNELIGSGNAMFINKLVKKGVLFTDAHGIGHPSQPNYLALFSGSTQGVKNDECMEDESPLHTPNLGASLIEKGYTFKGFAQGMPKAGFLGCTYQFSDYTIAHLYARKHTPWVNWLGTGPNTIPLTCSVPVTEFPKDFSKLPTLSFVIPDMDHDMHNIGFAGDAAAIRRGDAWLKDHLAEYAEWAEKHNSLLIVTFDEDDYTSKNGNRIPTIFYGAKLIHGEYGIPTNHYTVLHTIEAMYNLPVTDNILSAPITGIWGK